MKILTEATPTALWFAAVQEAENQAQIELKTDIESYLVFLLIRYTTHQELAKETMTTKFLQGLQYSPHLREPILQNVGDQCLLISGLFPAFILKRRLQLKYYNDMGQLAYDILSHKNNDLFSLLSRHFLSLISVLRSFRPKINV
jgi:hypothetical protein